MNEPNRIGAAPLHVPKSVVVDIDLFGQASGEDPYRVLHDASRLGKIFFNIGDNSYDARGVWIVNDMDLAHLALKLPTIFSSEGTTNFSAMLGEKWSLMPIELNPPGHSSIRSILNALFSTERMKRLEPAIRGAAIDRIRNIRTLGRCDFVQCFANPFPMVTFIQLLGLPLNDLSSFLKWERDLLHSSSRLKRIISARAIVEFFRKYLSEKRAVNNEGLISSLSRTKINGKPLSEPEILSICVMLFIAGLDTVSASLGLMFRHLAMDPEGVQRELRCDMDRIPDAVVEMLRRYSIINDRTRIVVSDTDVLGVHMKRGDRVLFPTALLNLSERAFKEPLDIDIMRDNSRHAAFFFGPHRCLGRHLAKIQLTVAVEEWLRNIPAFNIEGGIPVPINTSSGVFCVDELNIEWPKK